MASIRILMSPARALGLVNRPSTVEHQLLTRVLGNVMKVSVAGVCHKDRMDPVARAVKPAPWPYKEKRFRSWRYFLGESTFDRFDENTVLVSIEGLPGSGKHELAKKFAEATDMYHQPKANFDFMYIRPDGFDFRTFNTFYSKDAQYADLDMFLQNPKHPKAGRMQCDHFRLKYFFYLEAMIHLMHTGQGVVMERAPWSDQVFMHAMYKCGFTNKDHADYYRRIRHNVQVKLWRPHLIIYIDTPIDVAMNNIKKRNDPKEVNSPVWKTDFLKHVDEFYKETILPEYDEHAHVVVYPYQENFDVNTMLYDIERIDFQVNLSSHKLCDWRIGDDLDFCDWRDFLTNNTEQLMNEFKAPTWDVDGYDYTNEAEAIQFQTERSLVPSYYPGFHPEQNSVLKLAFKRKNGYWNDRLINVFKAYTP